MRIARIIFFLLLASIPVQLGKHFWPNFAFVEGIRIDYLAPTLYVSDILFIFLFFFSIRSLARQAIRFFTSNLYLLTIAILIFSGALSLQPLAAFYGIVKVIEFSYFAFYVSQTFTKRDFPVFLYILTLSGLVVTVILFLQFISQASLGGVFYFLGERTFTQSTPGVAVFSSGQGLVLRPSGTFPHPNVAAFFLLFPYVFLLYSMRLKKGFVEVLKSVAFLIILFGIVITFSRIVLLIAVVFLIHRLVTRSAPRKLFGGVILFILGLLIIVLPRFEYGLLSDFTLRTELIQVAGQVFWKSPFFGVGLNNFFYHEIDFQRQITPTLLQPVHNIYLLWLCSVGAIGFAIFMGFFIKVLRRVAKLVFGKQSIGFAVGLLLLFVVVAGAFDHYFMTLQQGQLLVALLFGLAFSRAIKD